MSEVLKLTIKRVGEKYVQAPKPLKIAIGKVLEGKISLKNQGGKFNG